MADTIASALFGSIFKTLTDEAFQKFARSRKIHSELNELQNTLSRVEALLNDASRKEITDESVGLWLNKLQHLAYDIEDILDDVATRAMHRELGRESGGFTSKVRNAIPTWCTNLSLSESLHHKLDSITRRLQDLENQKTILGLVVKIEKEKINNNRRNESCLPESDVVGREDEKEKLINKLLGGDSSEENFSIIPIVGMGGVGKTTLARLLYNDKRVRDHFELMAWVCVSDDFDIFKISASILESATRENKSFNDLNQLQMALIEQFKGTRFLLVLDDVWTESYEDWEKLVRPFLSCAPRSRIIVTTRKEDLLKKIGFDHLDYVESLSDRDALSLLARHALGVDSFDSHPSLRSKGEGIVAKCGCLPLALKAIGRLLRTKIDEEDWDDVLNSEIWNSNTNVGDLSAHWKDIFPALWLSYHDLSADSKRLFAYCSLFPKDFLFDKENLVLLWMAEGFLNESNVTKPPERFGEEHFEALLSRSFFQQAPDDESFFVMHDLMNDLATFVARDQYLRFENQVEIRGEALAKYRHMSFIREEYVAFQKFEAFKRARSLRTFLAVSIGVDQSWYNLSNKIFVDLMPRLPLLRVLSLKSFNISEVPDFIGKLKHLRYLNLSRTEIEELPESVGNLYNLQTLILLGCVSLAKLPKSFVKLKKLRHFDIRDTPSLKKLPVGIGELKRLRTFTKIIIGGEDGFAITELKGLSNLHGEISIEGLHNVQSTMHAYLSQRRLTKLELKWGDGSLWGDGSRSGTSEKGVLDKLKPHTDMLKYLNVEFYEGTEFPGWIGDPSFHQLVRVSIRGCRKCKFLPPLGQLSSLKDLFIQGMDEVKVIGSELTGTFNGTAFSSLETLSFKDMSGWEIWSTNNEDLRGAFPHLREIHIQKCPNLREVSVNALPKLRVLNIYGCANGVLSSLVRAASSITELKIDSISELTDEVWRDAMQYLGAVEEVSISSCHDIRYLWESEAHASMVLGNIKKLYIGYCENLVSLGEKEDDEDNICSNLLSSLRSLTVSHCKSMERCSLNNNSIERLSVSNCDSLTNVSFIGGEGLKLKSLSISGCKKLMEKINNTSMSMLEDVSICGWTNLKSLIQLSTSIHLTSMHIEDCPSIESFPDIQLPNLTDLTIERCQNLKSFPDIQLPNLTSLKITSCENLKSFSDIQLPNLTSLSIEICENLKSFPELQIPNLTSLSISSCKNLKSFPDLQLMNLRLLTELSIIKCPSIDASFPGGHWPPNLITLWIGGSKKPISEWGFQNFPTSLVDLSLYDEADVRNFSQLSRLLPSSLKKLQIINFEKLESLSVGLQHLTSLQHLEFYRCPKMKRLPETLLPSLLSLRIWECPILSKRCNGRGSRYWPLISHIPHLGQGI